MEALTEDHLAKKSHLYEFHIEHGRMTEFGGFDMPLWYGGIIEEHNAVRNSAGLFDVSHMGRFLVKGEAASKFLNFVFPSDVAKFKAGRAFYSTLCNDAGGIIDDTITNKISENEYMVIVNASNRDKDLEWLREHMDNYSVEVDDISDSSALIAFQGPLALELLQNFCDVKLDSVKRSHFVFGCVGQEKCLVSRTGYTGEDGFEVVVFDTPVSDPKKAMKIWDMLLESGKGKGVLPCGLGARDLLRLEAGMCLHGQDIDDTTTPIEASLDVVVNLSKADSFIGRNPIEKQMLEGVTRKRVAFSMSQSGIPRHGYELRFAGKKVGAVTSGSFSPLTRKGIGMGYVPPALSGIGSTFGVDIRGSERMAEVVPVPFYDTTKYGYKRQT